MKKTVLVVALAIGVTAAFAQDLTSKKGEKFLPEANDWAIGFDAVPVLNAVGRVMGGPSTTATGLTNPDGSSMYIVGKMFKDEKTAYRAALGINFGSTTDKKLVNDVTSTATPQAQVTDEHKASTNDITLGAGLEKRRGTTRLQGYYGGMLTVMFGGGKNTYTYGNALTTSNTSHTNSFGQGAGVTSNKSGSNFGLSLNGFIGAEYFVAPKISIGAEYRWGVGFNSQGEGEKVTESWSGTAVTTTTNKTAGGSSFGLGNGIGSIMANFHF